ncbi:TPA: YbhB/YbcL family Raf kinase inhibitor-like protein [Candidatus Uhrbacteria bacterium]|nr:YbhB/YbcL family Raf kinase inhibitor-like protein [Candidatus Uhrbacteria bacterium]HCU31976.1 YbhB/YbcL family Raf kinase inhibitor-like protein [Candidatus Uhrbacteria bacterium]
MILQSVDIKPNGAIPALHTCDGANVSPHLEWSEVPGGTKSFALSCFDPDSPSGNFLHWLVVNIPADKRDFSQGGKTGGDDLKNDFGGRGWGGPCPMKGTHKYVFTLYALNTERLENITKENFVAVVEQKMLDKAELIGKYRRK